MNLIGSHVYIAVLFHHTVTILYIVYIKGVEIIKGAMHQNSLQSIPSGMCMGFPCHRARTHMAYNRETRLYALLGIDLGTTNSSVAIIGQSGPRVIPDMEGRTSVPSEVLVETHVREWYLANLTMFSSLHRLLASCRPILVIRNLGCA